MSYDAGYKDIVIIGGGHAGIEAGLAAARLGVSAIIFTINLDAIGNLPCNPSIGGTAKGHLVCEVDALGGEMGKAADKTTIQSRMLNKSKGPAVHSLRAQIDRRDYSTYMKHILELEKNLDVKQTEIVSINKLGENNWEATTKLGAVYKCKAIIIATGTYLMGKIFTGDVSFESGPDGMFSSTKLSQSLKNLDIELMRFKTGTPARVNRADVDFSELEIQYGDEKIVPFSFETKDIPKNKSVCYITYTNQKTKEIILDNLDRSPLYSGKIEGVGPRYCPSIEDKIVRFSDKERHQVFIEPCGINTEELYLQGLSSSLPEEVQIKLLRTIKGFEHIKLMRNAYAIEYDCCNPLQLYPTLEFIKHEGLYGAGQFNGSSGYEEAAAQGLIAGINAALKIKGQEQIILPRSSSYIGTLIDDLITKGVSDPYRMMTSRSEYRLLLRQDNADMRLTEIGYNAGLINEERYKGFLNKKEKIEEEIKRAKGLIITPTEKVNKILTENNSATIVTGIKLADLLKRPQLNYKNLKEIDSSRPDDLADEIIEVCEIEIKYEGYIKRQISAAEELLRLEKKLIPKDIIYKDITGLRLEAIEKLEKIKPLNIGQASRISGVSPADITVLLIYLSTLN